MKYIVIDRMRDGGFDSTEFETKEEAIKQGKYLWNHLTKTERKHRDYVSVLESWNPDEEALDHFDGDRVWLAYDMDELENKAFDMLMEYFDGKDEPTEEEVGCKANDIVRTLLELATEEDITKMIDSIVYDYMRN